jgi:hypothetical protein
MGKRPVIELEQPRSEPEILPPSAASEFERRQHIYVGHIGPVGVLAALLVAALLAITALVPLFSVLLISIPVAVVLLAAAIVSGWWRGWFRSR